MSQFSDNNNNHNNQHHHYHFARSVGNNRPPFVRIQGRINLMNNNAPQFSANPLLDPTLRESKVVLENISMVFHENSVIGDDDFSAYDFSLGAPSYLGGQNTVVVPKKLTPAEKIANKNISQYFGRSSTRTADVDSDNDVQDEEQVVEREDPEEDLSLAEESLVDADTILGSIRYLVPDKATLTAQSETAVPTDYADRLLGTDDEYTTSTMQLSATSTMQLSAEFPEPTKKHKNKKKRWFGGRVFKKNKDKTKGSNQQEKKRHSFFKRSLPPAASTKPRETPSRMASF